MIAIGGSRQHRLAGRDMFPYRIGQVFEIESPIPVRQHRRMVVRPPHPVGSFREFPAGTHHLNVVDAQNRRQLPVVEIDVNELPPE